MMTLFGMLCYMMTRSSGDIIPPGPDRYQRRFFEIIWMAVLWDLGFAYWYFIGWN